MAQEYISESGRYRGEGAMSFDPMVSIIIPVYNGANFLGEAIDSALSQTYGNLEVIVVNDGSSDQGETEEIALSYGDRVRYFFKENGGVATALNMGIEEMRGDYLSWLSHDDLYAPQKVAAQVEHLRGFSDPSGRVLYSDYDFLDEETGLRRRVSLENDDPAGFRFRLLTRSDIHGCTMLVPRTAFRVCGGFDPELKATQDYDMWFRLGAAFEFTRVPASLVTGRVHGGQLGTRIPWRVEENRKLRQQWIGEIGRREASAFTGESEARSFAHAAAGFARAGNFGLASGCARRAFGAPARNLRESISIRFELAAGYAAGTVRSLYRILRRWP